MATEKIMFTLSLLLFLLTIQQVAAIPHPINITVTNTTIVIQDGLLNQSFSNTPATYAFTATTDCSSAFNYTAINASVDYDRIRNSSICNINYNLSCPQPTCPEPSCPAATCPALDYAQVTTIINTATDASSEKVVGKLSEMNGSITATLQKNKGVDFSQYYPYAAIVLAVVAFLTRNWWIPRLKGIKETVGKTGGEGEHPR